MGVILLGDYMKVCGIDPGKKGGLSIVEDDKLIDKIVMPINEEDNIDWEAIADFLAKHKPNIVYIEQVSARPGQGVCSMFSFGKSYGGLFGVCGALKIKVKTVIPRTWQKKLLGEGTHEKEDTIAFCKSKYPGISLLATSRSKVDHDGMSDAIGIASYGYNEETNINNVK
jgi:Holliday junction resolvasome RuvABC endonuclease subunit